MGDDERRPPLGRDDVVDGPLDDALRLGVERGRRLVEHEDLRVADERARDGHALLLAARQLDAAVADLRLEAVGERAHEVERVRELRGALDVRAARARAAVGDVVGDGAAEEHGLLGDEADLRAQRGDVGSDNSHDVSPSWFGNPAAPYRRAEPPSQVTTDRARD